MAGTLGAHEVVGLSAQLEAASEWGSTAGTDALVAALDRALDRASDALIADVPPPAPHKGALIRS